jgi:tetratricopeptide (TPR) repeat protein
LVAAAFGGYRATRPPVHVLQYELGLAHMEAGDFTAASQCFEQALDARSDFVQAQVLRGWADLKASQREGLDPAERSSRLGSALQSFDASWTRTKSAESAASLACCYEQMGGPEAAKAYLSKAVDLGLGTSAVLNNLGYYILNTKDKLIPKDKYVEAVARLADAVRLDPKLQVAHHNLAVARCKLAETELTQAFRERVGGHEEAAAGCVDRAAENLRSATEHIEAALQSGSRSADLELAAASIYARYASDSFRGQRGEAADAMEQELLEKAWKSCLAAVELHLSPNRLSVVATLAPKLGQDPRFQKLLKESPKLPEAAPAKPLADVYPDIRDRLLGIDR